VTIVVGVDGSPGGDDALRFALTEARLRKSRLQVVHAYQLPRVPVPDAGNGAAGFAPPAVFSPEEADRLEGAARAEAEGIIESALARVGRNAAEGVEIEPAPLVGAPAQILIESGRDAELLVVGSRGHGGFVGLLLGSVSQQCAQHPPCPVVILPPPEESPGARDA
jgi:nucleotide-binding universal stress UspA family protein